MPDGRYRLGSIEVDVKDGACTFEGKLAGSVLAMDTAVQNFARFSGSTLADSLAAATRHAARAAGALMEERSVLGLPPISLCSKSRAGCYAPLLMGSAERSSKLQALSSKDAHHIEALADRRPSPSLLPPLISVFWNQRLS